MKLGLMLAPVDGKVGYGIELSSRTGRRTGEIDLWC